MKNRASRRARQNQKPNLASRASQPPAQKEVSPNSPLHETDATDGTGGHRPSQYQRRHWLDYLTAAFAFVAALGGLVAGIAGGYQGWVARDAEKTSNRAIVISTDLAFISYEEPTDPKRTWQVAPVVENVGNTPTKALRYLTRLGICGPIPTKTISDQALPWVNTPDDQYVLRLIGPKSSINGATIHATNVTINCPSAIIAYGLIKYYDVFDNPHITEFCNFINSIEDFSAYPAGRSIRVQAKACRDHNCSDEECGADWRDRARN
jgi:hypothetical protein